MEKINDWIRSKREDFQNQPLGINDLGNDPIDQFNQWLQEAKDADVLDPLAVNLSTVNSVGMPSSRVLYLRDIIDGKFVYYTNYQSQKSVESAANNQVCLNFHWKELQRQVKINGVVERTDPEVSDAYFASRPRASQIGAWSSDQSHQLTTEDALANRVAEMTKKFENHEVIPRPEHWGGWQVVPTLIEFWQGRPSRLHDRIVFTYNGGEWHKIRLNP